MVDEWKKAKSPNYEINKDKLYPYSEMPCLEYEFVKIPFCIQNLIEHVDYYGEGRIELDTGTRGFPDCYNVHYEDKLVHDGPDKGRKIPNRIPLPNSSKNAYHARSYIKDNSVLTVTVNLQVKAINYNIFSSTFEDIARVVNSEKGKVIIYGYYEKEIEMISDELRKMKQLYYCPIYLLPEKLRLTYWKTCYRVYLGMRELKRELYLNINKGDFEAAVILTGCLTDTLCGGALGDVVNKLLRNNDRNVIAYAYKLWNSNNKEVVRDHFPSVFQHMFNGDCMTIINKLNNQALVLEPKTTKAQGDGNCKTSKKLGWKIIPMWGDNNVFFKLYNVDSDMYLQLTLAAGSDDDKRGKNDSEEKRETFSFSPVMENRQVAFNILNYEDDKQLLELPADVNSSEVKAVVGQKSDCNVQDGQSCWILTSSKETVNKEKQTDESEDEDFSNIYYYD